MRRLCVLLALGCLLSLARARGAEASAGALDDATLAALVETARTELAVRQGREPRRILPRPATSAPLAAVRPVRVVYLAQGRPAGSGRCAHSSLAANARLAAAAALDALQPLPQTALACVVEVEGEEEPLALVNPADLPRGIDGGREGFAIRLGEKTAGVCASEILLSGESAEQHLQKAVQALGLAPEDILRPDFRLARRPAVLAAGLPGEAPFRLFRFNRLVLPDAVTADAVRASVELTKAWFRAHLGPDGELPYLYHPVRDEAVAGEEGGLPALTRRAFAIAAMGDLAAATQDEAFRKDGVRALDRLLADAYLEHPAQPWGYLKADGRVSLGSSAGALLAILRLGEVTPRREQAARLAAFLRALQKEDGRFILDPDRPESTAGEEYYPGEALLALLECHAAAPDPALPEAAAKAFHFYRAWWRKTRPVPFIPWHTQAGVRLYRLTRLRVVADFVFEMNDLLLAAQENGEDLAADLRGRFFNPDKRRGGYPHVSATGVYLEGLFDAFLLARELGDTERAERYRVAILRGLRNLLQMQIRGPYDTWCMPDPAKALGGFRSRWDYPGVRIDNQQHAGRALAEALLLFGPADYAAMPEAAKP